MTSGTKLSNKDIPLVESRFICIHLWYLCASSTLRVKFVKQLLEQVENVSVIAQILNIMRPNFSKECAYLKAMPESENFHDKMTIDHNKSLDQDILESTSQKDIEWFRTQSEPMQYQMLMVLLSAGGGALQRAIFFYAYQIWAEKSNSCGKNIALQEPSFELFNKNLGSNIPPSVRSYDLETSTKCDLPNINETPIDESLPAFKAVKSAKLHWDTIMSALTKLALSKTKGKRKKTGRQKNVVDFGSVDPNKNICDYFQLLPIWINRRILNFLEFHDLRNARQVNKYWKTQVDEVLKERDTREKLNKTILNLQIKRLEEAKRTADATTDECAIQDSKVSNLEIEIRQQLPRKPKTPKRLYTCRGASEILQRAIKAKMIKLEKAEEARILNEIKEIKTPKILDTLDWLDDWEKFNFPDELRFNKHAIIKILQKKEFGMSTNGSQFDKKINGFLQLTEQN